MNTICIKLISVNYSGKVYRIMSQEWVDQSSSNKKDIIKNLLIHNKNYLKNLFIFLIIFSDIVTLNKKESNIFPLKIAKNQLIIHLYAIKKTITFSQSKC